MGSNQTFIVAAYTVTWVVVLGYLVRLLAAGARARTAYEGAVGSRAGESNR